MLFNSFTFIVFFALVFIVYYTLPHKFRWLLLLAASLTFYMWWKAELIVLIIISTLINYLAAMFIKSSHDSDKRKLCLALSMIINFSLLFVFKYLVFTHNLITYFTGAPLVENFNIILPMGISFYTFQAAAYTIDVYRGKIEPQRNYLKFTLFITFFPQLVAGPIERAENLMPQLFSKKQFDFNGISGGLKIAIFGLFKKVVIADRAAVIVNGVFNSVPYYGFLAYVLAAFLFSIQIYCDFSGYSDIAVGCSKMLGIDLMQNFKHPYFAHSLKDFWRRWHISLSTWFKDYLYFPLGGNRVSKPRYYFNIMTTFIVSGLWHGANVTFIVWGALHGLFQVMGSIMGDVLKPKKYEDRHPVSKLVSIMFTFGLVVFLFTIFRANTIEDAAYLFTHFFWGFRDTFTPQGFYDAITTMPGTLYELIVILFAVVFLFAVELLERRESIHEILNRKPAVFRFAFYWLILSAIFALGVFSGGEDFIYFQF